MVWKQDERKKETDKQLEHLWSIQQEFENTVAGDWLANLIKTQRHPFARIKQWEQSKDECFDIELKKVIHAINHLPVWEQTFKRMAVFSAEVTGNPHDFDEGKGLFYYLCYGISYALQIPYQIQTLEEKTELLYKAGILRDEISNYVTCYGVHGIKTDGVPHEGMEAYVKLQEPQQLNLVNLSNLKDAFAIKKHVFVVENPAVFQYLLLQEEFQKETIVCGNGQLRMAAWVLLDFFGEE